MAVNTETQENKKPMSFIFSISFFILILLLTIGLFVFNKMSENKIEGLNNELSQVNSNIQIQKEEGYYVVYKMTQNSKGMLERYRNYSAIPEFVANLEQISKDNNIIFRTFNYNNGKLQTTSAAIDTDKNLAYNKVSSFIKNFREDNDNIFSLDFVSNLTGQETIKFNTTFNLR